MKITTTNTIYCLAVLFLSTASADPVYTWVDAEGVTHYSKTPPADGAIDPGQVEIQALPVAEPAPESNHYSIARQAERMEKSRLVYEKVKTERLKAEAEVKRATAAATAAQQQSTAYDNDNYYRSYPVYPYTPRYRPGYRRGHRPGHKPGHRPGHLPEPGVGSPRSRPRVIAPGRK